MVRPQEWMPEIVSSTVIWAKSGHRVTVGYVLVRDPIGEREPQASLHRSRRGPARRSPLVRAPPVDCLLAEYEPAAQFSLHKDKSVRGPAHPIVSISLGCLRRSSLAARAKGPPCV